MKKIISAVAVVMIASVGYLLVGNKPAVNNNNTVSVKESVATETLKESVSFDSEENTVTFAPSGEVLKGKVNMVIRAVDGKNTILRIGGEFPGGTFCFAVGDKTAEGVLMMPEEGLAWVLEPSLKSSPVWHLKKMSEIACAEMPVVGAGAAAVVTPAPTITKQEAVPILNSRVGAKGTVLLDFIGGSIQDPMWNGGKVIDAKAAMYTADQIKQTFDVVAERYAAFSVNVTTDPSVYAAAPVKRRMRVILTTTNFISGYGGYAYISSYRNSGSGVYSATIPCFAFVSNVGGAKNAGEVCAHEVGHTLGLNHDGKSGSGSTVYYSGQGNWAPVMGTAYSKTVVQWSKGEYTGANNREDDINTIASCIGGGTSSLGYSAINNAANPIVLSGSLTGAVSNSMMSSYYTVNVVSAGSLTVNVNVPLYGGLNTSVEIQSNGVILAKNNGKDSLNSSVVLAVKPGKYTVRVSGEGEGDANTTGYSSYGSIGSFNVKATVK